MPTFRGISLSLVSQYDAKSLPEYPPPISHASYVPNNRAAHNDSSLIGGKAAKFIPPHHPVVDVYVPSYPSSQFWISYEVAPSASNTLPPTRFFYFKLSLNGEDITSWAVGKQDSWKGKTMWTFAEGMMDRRGRQRPERRGFFFKHPQTPSTRYEEGVLEVRVFRSRGRRRMENRGEALYKANGPGEGIR